MSHKTCSGCELVKSLDEFFRDKTKPDGRHPRCKSCHRKTYWQNHAARLEARREYVAKNRESINRKKREYYWRKHDIVRAQAKNHYSRNREEVLEKNKYWRKTALRGQFFDCKRGAKKRGLSFALTFEHFCFLKQEACIYCGTSERIGIDRLDNSQGYIEGNMAPCCIQCNRMKGTLSVSDFLRHCQTISDRRQLILSYIEGVAPECRTVAEALAWRNQSDIPPAVLT